MRALGRGRPQLFRSEQPLDFGLRARHGSEDGHRTIPVGHLEGLACLYSLEPPAGVLPKLPYADPLHVLHGSTSTKEFAIVLQAEAIRQVTLEEGRLLPLAGRKDR